MVTAASLGDQGQHSRAHGFDEMEHIGRDEARARYFGGRHDVEIAGAQALVSAMVRSPSAVARTDG